MKCDNQCLWVITSYIYLSTILPIGEFMVTRAYIYILSLHLEHTWNQPWHFLFLSDSCPLPYDLRPLITNHSGSTPIDLQQLIARPASLCLPTLDFRRVSCHRKQNHRLPAALAGAATHFFSRFLKTVRKPHKKEGENENTCDCDTHVWGMFVGYPSGPAGTCPRSLLGRKWLVEPTTCYYSLPDKWWAGAGEY